MSRGAVITLVIACVAAAGAWLAPAARAADVLDHAAILQAAHLAQPQWYEDNIPFLDTPDAALDEVYYYRWSTYKRALRYTVPGTGYISTEYDVPIDYASDPYSGLPDAAGYHITDGRWLRDPQYAGDYIDFWLRGAGTSGQRSYSEWIAAAAYERYLVTGDATQLKADLRQVINLYNAWGSNFNSGYGLYFQSPLSDATEFTETSMHSSDWFGGGAGYRPTINTYQYAAAQAISRIAALTGDNATAAAFAARAAALKQGVQDQLWDPQRQFFMQIYNGDRTNGALQGTRTTWREAMGFTPWLFDLPDPQYATAWKSLTDPDRFAAPYGPRTLERWDDFTPDASGNVALTAPAAGTWPVRVYGADPGTMTVNGAAPVAVSGGSTVEVALQAGSNTLHFSGAVDRVQANPYYDFDAIPASPNRDDFNCCHWDGPSWPYATSMMLTGLANVLDDYPAQSDVTAADYRRLLDQFAALQHKDGRPYVAEAADGDTGRWIYDAENFSENYNHSSFDDLVLNGLIGIRPQAGDTLVLAPLVSPGWDWFAVEDVPYHGHLLTILWDRDGSHYGRGSGLQVLEDGRRIYSSPTLAKATIAVGGRRVPAPPARMVNVLSNPNSADQSWLSRTITQPYPRAFASFTNPASNGRHCHSGQTCKPATYDSPAQATDGWIGYDRIPEDRWTNAGSPNPTDYLGVDLGAPRPLDELKLYTYDDGDTIRAPRSYDVQYLDGDTWRSVPGQRKSPPVPAADDANEVTFPTVTTSQVRVVFTPQPGRFVGVTELESWWPQRAPVRLVNVNSGLALGVAGDSVNYGAAAQQQTATGSDSQRWDLVPAQDGYYKIINRGSGLVLGISGASKAYGATALQWGDNLTPDHLWAIVDAGGGEVKLVNENSGLDLGIENASVDPGAVALQWGDNGTADHLWRLVTSDRASASEDAPVGGTVPATLALTLGSAPSFGAFTPGVAHAYTAATTAGVTSTAGDAALTVSDPSASFPGHLVNGPFALPQPLRVGGQPLPATVERYEGPVSNDVVPIELEQSIGATDALRTGTYAKALTFSLSTTEP